jgi:hypothetical protein
MMVYKYNPPQHYTLENLCYLLKRYPIERLLITEKADGIYQSDNLDGYGECEYEYVEETNKKYIFNSKKNIIKEPKYYDELKEMITQDRNDTIDRSVINKPYYRLNNYLIEYLDDLIDLKNEIYLTDGWILVNDNFDDLIIKLKPLEHMTIDLYYNSGNKKWLTRENKVIDIKIDENIQSGIWRLYWKNFRWVPEDRRYDKKRANNYKVIKYIIDFINKPFKIFDVIEMLSQQELYYQVSNNPKSKSTCDYIKYNNEWIRSIIGKYCNKGDYVLDIGCGKGKYVMNDTKWYGIDIDLGSLYKPNNRHDNFVGIWMDFSMKWDPNIQTMRLGKLWSYYRTGLYEMKQNKFDVVLWLYSIHFCYTMNQLIMIFQEIDMITKTDSLLIINLLKKDFEGLKTSNGYIRRKDDVLVRYYDWCNTKESIEKIWDIKEILIASKKWYIFDMIDFDDIDNEWNEWHKNNYICILKKI